MLPHDCLPFLSLAVARNRYVVPNSFAVKEYTEPGAPATLSAAPAALCSSVESGSKSQ